MVSNSWQWETLDSMGWNRIKNNSWERPKDLKCNYLSESQSKNEYWLIANEFPLSILTLGLVIFNLANAILSLNKLFEKDSSFTKS